MRRRRAPRRIAKRDLLCRHAQRVMQAVAHAGRLGRRALRHDRRAPLLFQRMQRARKLLQLLRRVRGGDDKQNLPLVCHFADDMMPLFQKLRGAIAGQTGAAGHYAKAQRVAPVYAQRQKGSARPDLLPDRAQRFRMARANCAALTLHKIAREIHRSHHLIGRT